MAHLTLQRSGQGCAFRSRSSLRPAPRQGGMVIPFPRPHLEPAADSCPIIGNDQGRREIPVASRRFGCIGATPPHDHPRIFLNIDARGEASCPYCYTKFRLDRFAE